MTTTMMIVDYLPWHLDAIKLSPESKEEVERFNVARIFKSLAPAGLVGTIVSTRQSTILGIVGAGQTRENVCEVFVLPSEDRHRAPRVFVIGVKRVLAGIRKKFARVEAIGDDTPFFDRWFRWLGFNRGGLISRPEFVGKKMRIWDMVGTK